MLRNQRVDNALNKRYTVFTDASFTFIHHEDRVLCGVSVKNQSHEIFGITLVRSGEIWPNLEDLRLSPFKIQRTLQFVLKACVTPLSQT